VRRGEERRGEEEASGAVRDDRWGPQVKERRREERKR